MPEESEQPELPGLPEPPEPPEIYVLFMWIVHKLFGDPALIKQNWRAILLAAFILTLLARWVDKSIYESRINSLEGADKTSGATIEIQKATIQEQATTLQQEANTVAQLQDELKGTSPQLAAIQAGRDAIRTQLQNFYVEGGILENRDVKTPADVDAWEKDTNEWSVRINGWASLNMGQAAAFRIF